GAGDAAAQVQGTAARAGPLGAGVARERRTGRPRKAEAPEVPYDEVDRLLVFGDVVQLPDGGTTTVYPTYRELAERYGVATSIIATYAKSRNCVRRRERARARIESRTESKLIEMRADALAVGKDDIVGLIDAYLAQFKQALSEGRVRADNPTDVNTLVRLREFLLGGADSRQDVRATLSLESLQERYVRSMRARQSASLEQTGFLEPGVETRPLDVTEATSDEEAT
ncbi:MAG TPA: hypothetical protein PKU97_19690, partial [Kofleriaceae bacterium]|nr:hypothetical protein [Kofleriaceae bacterium]